MKITRLSAIYERSLFSVVVAAALLLGAGARAWAQGNGTLQSEPDHLSVKREENPPTVERAPVSDAALSSSQLQEASPSPSPTPGVATSATMAETPACSTTTRSAALPVVFVPGTAGSELRLTSPRQNLDDELYWIGANTLSKNNLGRAPLDELGRDQSGNNVTAPRSLSGFFIPDKLMGKLSKPGMSLFQEEIYSDFLLWAQAVFKGGFYEVPYDWRKGANPEAAALVAKGVNEALCKSGQPKVILLAHSLGGIVARDYIEQTKGEKVAALIAVGTPWLGTPKTARALLLGYNFGAGKSFTFKKPITVQGDAEDFAGNQYCRINKDKLGGYECPYLVRFSFFKLEDAAKLARNFPAVYQQLPTREFMEKYGAFYGKDFRAVILGMKTWEKMENFYKSKDERKRGNEYLYMEAQRLRQRILNVRGPHNSSLRGPNDYGVSNYLIAGVYSGACREPKGKDKEDCSLDNVMDMQMAEMEKVKRSFVHKMASLGLRALNGIVRPLGYLFTREKFGLREDRYVATDSDVDWGDGTSPLLSATAGEYLKGVGDHRFPGAACDLLGEDTQVLPVMLAPPYPHSAMLNDPRVRDHLRRIYIEKNSAPGLDPTPGEPAEVVTSLTIKLFSETSIREGRINVSYVEREPKYRRDRLSRTVFINGATVEIPIVGLLVRDTRIVIPNVKHNQPPLGVLRRLRKTDCSRVFLELQSMSGTLRFNEYQISINGKVVATSNQSFTLKTNPLQIDLQCP